MSTIQSSSEHLVLNADGASKEIKLQANGVEKAKVTSTGIDVTGTCNATSFTGDGSALTGISGGVDGITSSSTTSTAIQINSLDKVTFGTNSPPGGTDNYQGVVIYAKADKSTPLILQDTQSSPSGQRLVKFQNSGGTERGSITHNSGSVSYNTTSDYRLKENVEPMTGSIDRLKELKPSRFNFIADATTTVDGFLAHEVSDIVPEAISGEKDATKEEEYEVTPAVLDDDGNVVTEAVMGTRTVPDYQGIDQSKLTPLLTSALQEAIEKIESLEARIDALENA